MATRILLAEDEEAIASELAPFLERSGFMVTVAHTGGMQAGWVSMTYLVLQAQVSAGIVAAAIGVAIAFLALAI